MFLEIAKIARVGQFKQQVILILNFTRPHTITCTKFHWSVLNLTSSKKHALISYAAINLNKWETFQIFYTEIIAMALFKQFKLAARIYLAKTNLSHSSLFMEKSFAATHSSKVKFLKRAREQPRYTHSFPLNSFFQDTRLILRIL